MAPSVQCVVTWRDGSGRYPDCVIFSLAAVCLMRGRTCLNVRKKGADHVILPGGKIELGETPLEAAIREAREETRLVLDPDDLKHLGERIAELAAQITAATYQLLALIRDFDERGGWHSAYGGFATCAHWLSWRTGLALGASREHVRVARALGELPQLSEAISHRYLVHAGTAHQLADIRPQ